jgi:hypothetical protein
MILCSALERTREEVVVDLHSMCWNNIIRSLSQNINFPVIDFGFVLENNGQKCLYLELSL